MPPLLAFENVTKRYRDAGQDVLVLDGVSFEVDRGDSIGVQGFQRSGKSTLLRIAAGIELPDEGVVWFDGQDLTTLSDTARARLLREKIGLASSNLPATRTQRVVDFVALPVLSKGASSHEGHVLAREILDRLGASTRADASLASLSRGERIRVSIAQALIREPLLMLVDEPSGSPSPTERDEIHALLKSFAHDPALTIIVASEDVAAIRTARRAMTISDGMLRSLSHRSARVVPFPDSRSNRAHGSS